MTNNKLEFYDTPSLLWRDATEQSNFDNMLALAFFSDLKFRREQPSIKPTMFANLNVSMLGAKAVYPKMSVKHRQGLCRGFYYKDAEKFIEECEALSNELIGMIPELREAIAAAVLADTGPARELVEMSKLYESSTEAGLLNAFHHDMFMANGWKRIYGNCKRVEMVASDIKMDIKDEHKKVDERVDMVTNYFKLPRSVVRCVFFTYSYNFKMDATPQINDSLSLIMDLAYFSKQYQK